jgi:D-ribose pyranase
MEVEGVVLAEELRTVSPEMHERLLGLLRETQKDRGRELDVAYVPHDEFKRGTEACKAVIRTGEFTPYANIILKSGVVF